ncbi:MAG: hypothetical protein LBU55_01785 [Elusimicrobiota bacterium]|jgi:hypothetical protein|nr:hypothetical protein [Elusimicrobiota bacterium]
MGMEEEKLDDKSSLSDIINNFETQIKYSDISDELKNSFSTSMLKLKNKLLEMHVELETEDDDSEALMKLAKENEKTERTYDVQGLLIGGAIGIVVGVLISFDVIFAMEIGMFVGLVFGVRKKRPMKDEQSDKK